MFPRGWLSGIIRAGRAGALDLIDRAIAVQLELLLYGAPRRREPSQQVSPRRAVLVLELIDALEEPGGRSGCPGCGVLGPGCGWMCDPKRWDGGQGRAVTSAPLDLGAEQCELAVDL